MERIEEKYGTDPRDRKKEKKESVIDYKQKINYAKVKSKINENGEELSQGAS